ncbi:MAG TPA: T9SS type A sorting domain-containing protein, partial [Candidatus Babeliaceae bacterium]|nr:T9SS type A sorting domain-containing protein [Candidatus Babeliaceae bacterium]
IVVKPLPVPNKVPIADAGKDIQITLPENSATLEGGQSYDPDGTIISYHWEQIGGPSNATLLSSDSVNCPVSDLQAGTYGFKLIVTDNKGASATSTTSIFVNPPKDSTETTFTVYPNPVHDQLHVNINKSITALILFRIVDMNGRIIKIYNYGSLPQHINKVLDVSNLGSGIYLLQLIEDNQLRDTKKIIKY